MAPALIQDAASASSDNRSASLISIAVVFLSLSLAGLLARLVSKRMKHAPLYIDDFLLIFAWALCAAEAGLIIWAALHTALGHHAANVTHQELSDFQKALYAGELLQPTILSLAKVSVLLLLHRIFITKAFRITCVALLAIVLAWWIGIFFAQAFDCWPIRSHWDSEVQAVCGNQYIANIVAPIPWIVTDIAVLVAPMPMVRKLHIPTRQKVSLGALFLIGTLTCIVSIVRYRYGFYSLTDPTYQIVGLFNWTVVEANVTVLCASLIASKPVAMFLLPDGLVLRLSSYFNRSFRFSLHGRPSQPKASPEGTRPGTHSQTFLRPQELFELPRRFDSLHSETTDS